MARSGVWQDPVVEAWLLRANVEAPVERVCDVGAGWGRYGLPIRNLFPRVELVGIEIYAGFPKPELADKYDEWIRGEANAVLPGLGGFDITLMCDIIEHLPRKRALGLLGTALRQSRYVIMTTPLGPMRQGAVDDNPWEAHRSSWLPASFPRWWRLLGFEMFYERLPRTFAVFLGGDLDGRRERWPERTAPMQAEHAAAQPSLADRHNRARQRRRGGE